MTHDEFIQLRHAIAAMPPEQMERLRDEIERMLAASAAVPPKDQGEADADPILGLWRDYADEMDEIVADAYRKRQEDRWREFDL